MLWLRFVLLAALAGVVPAYSPPEDTAGPLTVRIEGPSTLSQAGTPFAVAVVLENKGESALGGTVRVQVIDGWRAEPAGPAPFAVEARSTARLSFAVTADAETYNAHYPIHAFASFESAGRQMMAHPVLIVETRLPKPPRPAAPRSADGLVRPGSRPPGIAGEDARAPRGSSRLLGTVAQAEGLCHYEVRIWPGQRGLLDSAIGFRNGSAGLYFHGFRVRVLNDALDDWRSPSTFVEAREEPTAGRYRVRHRFQTWAGSFDLLGELWTEQAQLRAHFWIENAPPSRPWLVFYLEDVSAGPWSEPARRLYAGAGNVLQAPQAFSLNFDGHRLSTSFAGFDFSGGLSLVQGVDVPPTRLEADPAARLYTLHAAHEQTLTFIPSSNVWEGVRVWREINGLKAAAGVAGLAGRFVFDLWGGRYADSAVALRRSARYGLRDAVVVWHNWQRWGYDYRLPEIYPPNPRFGTFDEFQDLVAAAKQNGMLFAPHDNYIDLYPDADGFSYRQIAFTRDGQPVKAWFNKGRNAQSYRWLTGRFLPSLERNVGLIRDGFAPTAYFIDVWSSVGPFDSWTADGRFLDRIFTRQTWGQAFAWIRDFLGGNAPQISESGHDQLIGWLDGAQTNHLRVDVPPSGESGWFVWPIRCADSERIPWFDAAHHDRFALHGAGYENRYAAGLDTKLHGMYSDDYIATEVLTGHPAMVRAAFGRDVVRKYWLLHDAMRALALRRIRSVEFAGNNLHRQHVTWDNGGEVWVNRGPEEWAVAGHTLPQYGFYLRLAAATEPSRPAGSASGSAPAPIEAAIERRDAVVVEWSRSPEMLYVNARAGAPVAFGAVTTDGAVRLTRSAGTLILTPLPDSRPSTVRLRWSSLPWQLPAPRRAESNDESANILKTVPVAIDSGEIVLTLDAGSFEYRLK